MSDTPTNQYGEPINTVVNTSSYGHGNTIHQRGTMQVEYILDIVPGAWNKPEDLANWMANHPYITKVTYTGEVGPTKLEQLKKVFDDAYLLADQTAYDRYTNTKVSNYVALDKAHFAACHARDIAWTVYNDELNNG
jgi:hypothetical protein